MSLATEKKSGVVAQFRRAANDTGSPEVQIAMLTHRINELAGHFNTHAKDHASRRGLLMLVSRRRRLLDYLRRHNQESYLNIIGRLSLRKYPPLPDLADCGILWGSPLGGREAASRDDVGQSQTTN